MDVGSDLSWLRPVTPGPEDGYRPHTLGTYRGVSEALCVQNPQPGWVYRWVNTASPNDVARQRMRGFQFVQRGDPEASTYVDFDPRRGSAQDSLVMFGRLALARIPVEQHRKLRDERRAMLRERVLAPTREFHSASDQMQRALGDRARGRAPYYARADHGVELEEMDRDAGL